MAITGIEVDGVMYDMKPVEVWCLGCAFADHRYSDGCPLCARARLFCPAFRRSKIFVKREVKG